MYFIYQTVFFQDGKKHNLNRKNNYVGKNITLVDDFANTWWFTESGVAV